MSPCRAAAGALLAATRLTGRYWPWRTPGSPHSNSIGSVNRWPGMLAAAVGFPGRMTRPHTPRASSRRRCTRRSRRDEHPAARRLPGVDAAQVVDGQELPARRDRDLAGRHQQKEQSIGHRERAPHVVHGRGRAVPRPVRPHSRQKLGEAAEDGGEREQVVRRGGGPYQPARLAATIMVGAEKPKRPRIEGAAIGWSTTRVCSPQPSIVRPSSWAVRVVMFLPPQTQWAGTTRRARP